CLVHYVYLVVLQHFVSNCLLLRKQRTTRCLLLTG
ncbi:L-serine ammonia-lyase, partial [Vibrio parahaemolyticus V-223/04]